MANIKACFSHNSDDWRTPSKLYDTLMAKGFLDPCPYLCKEDRLGKSLPICTKVFINPPYSKMNEWVNYGIELYIKYHCEVCFLIPSRTDTKYFHELLSYNPVLYFIKGRLHFNDSSKNAPFPSMFIKLGKSDTYDKFDYYSVSLEHLIAIIRDGLL